MWGYGSVATPGLPVILMWPRHKWNTIQICIYFNLRASIPVYISTLKLSFTYKYNLMYYAISPWNICICSTNMYILNDNIYLCSTIFQDLRAKWLHWINHNVLSHILIRQYICMKLQHLMHLPTSVHQHKCFLLVEPRRDLRDYWFYHRCVSVCVCPGHITH